MLKEAGCGDPEAVLKAFQRVMVTGQHPNSSGRCIRLMCLALHPVRYQQDLQPHTTAVLFGSSQQAVPQLPALLQMSFRQCLESFASGYLQAAARRGRWLRRMY